MLSSQNLFRTKKLVKMKSLLDDCLALEQRLAEFEGSDEDYMEAEECRKKREKRLGITKVDPNAFFGDEENAPEGALAFYKGFGDQESVTVYDDRVEFDSKISNPYGRTIIMFSNITNLTMTNDPLSSIEIEYYDDKHELYKFSFSIYGKGPMVSPRGRAESKRLFDFLEKHRENRR